MALPFPINPNQTDAKSPIDQQLMDAIRLNQEFLDSQLGAGSAGGLLNFRVNGFLNRIKSILDLGAGKRVDGGLVTAAVTFSKASLYLEKGGTSGALEVDCFRHKEVQHPIEKIEPILSEAITSYETLGSPLTTQAVTREASDISTQLVSRVKAAVNIDSIQVLDGSKVLITLEGTTLLDSDYLVGKQVVISSATNGANNGTFEIIGVNIDNLPSILINNGSGVNQDLPAGSLDLNLFEYVFNASVDAAFVAGESVFFAGHSNANLDGFKEIVRTNDGGNNIICYVTNGVEQGAPSGTATNLRLRYTVAETVDPENYVVGELADFSGHSAGTNNGFLPIVAINEGGGNNVVILNATNGGGAVQAGAGGNVNTRRMVVSTGVDPDTLIEVGDLVKISGRAQSTQNGNFEVKLVKKFTLNNFVIYLGSLNNSSGAGGTYTTEKKIVTFREDFSAFYVAGESKVQLEGIADGAQDFEYDVTEINRGGFSNYNVVIKAIDLNEQLPAAGRVAREIRSIFLTRPRLEFTENKPRNLQVDSSATFKVGGVEADTILTLEIIEVPEGLPSTLVLSLS